MGNALVSHIYLFLKIKLMSKQFMHMELIAALMQLEKAK